jgi:hypothetical protein
MASAAALIALRNALAAEQERRARARGHTIAGDREGFYCMLDEVHKRRIASPNYAEPSPAQKALLLQDLDRYFRSLRR